MVAPACSGRLRTKSGSRRHSENRPCAEAGALDPLQPLAGDDLVGVDVGPVEGDRRAGDDATASMVTRLLSGPGRLGRRSGRRRRWRRRRRATPGGCARPGPWRPSKLRFDVDAQRSPGASLSGFMPRHIEQPAARHSKPAAMNTRSRPSASASAFTRMEPGTTMARMPAATWRPPTTAAAARRSSRRELVQEPMKTVSTAIVAHGRARGRGPCRRGPGGPARPGGVGDGVGVGHRAVDRRRPGTGWCPRSRGAQGGGVEDDLLVERRPRRRWPAPRQSSRARSQSAPRGGVGPPLS